MTTLKLYSLFFLSILISSSCQSEKPVDKEEEVGIQAVFLTEKNALFRGSNIGETPSQVRLKEKAKVIQDTDSVLHYHSEFKLQSGKTDVDFFYSFDEFGLFEIQVDFYPENDAAPKKLMEKVEVYLTSSFGDPKKLGIIKRWTTFSESNNLIEITLSNESADAGEPFISLNFLEPLADEI